MPQSTEDKASDMQGISCSIRSCDALQQHERHCIITLLLTLLQLRVVRRMTTPCKRLTCAHASKKYNFSR
jgi:hypothetical protein